MHASPPGNRRLPIAGGLKVTTSIYDVLSDMSRTWGDVNAKLHCIRGCECSPSSIRGDGELYNSCSIPWLVHHRMQ